MTTVASDTLEELSLEEMLEIISITEGLKERQFTLDDDTVSFAYHEENDSPLTISISGDEYNLTERAAAQAFQFAKIPKGILDNYDIDLIIPLINWWFSNKGGELKGLFKAKDCVAFVRPGTEIYSISEIIKELTEVLTDQGINHFVFEKVHHDLDETQFCLVAPHLTSELDNGDVVRKGFQVQHSLTGKIPLVISAYTSVDYYKNGMVSTSVFGQWDRRLGKKLADDPVETSDLGLGYYDVYSWTADVAKGILENFNKEVTNLNNIVDHRVGAHSGTFLNDLFSRYKISASIQKSIREEYADRQDQTVYDLWSAITTVASSETVIDKPSTSRHLMQVAAEISMHPHKCNECHRLLDN